MNVRLGCDSRAPSRFFPIPLLVLALCVPGRSQTSSPLASHWGASDYPEFKRGFQSGMSILSFTEFDSEGRTYGVTGKDTSGNVPYPETMGFNYLSLAYGNHVNSRSAELSNMMYRYTASMGLNSDRFTEAFQNQVIHKGYRSLETVPRGQVRCEDALSPECLEFGVSGEIFQRFTNIELEDKPKFYGSNFFVGVGASLSTPLFDGYMELGVSRLPTLITTDYLGLRVAGMLRVGGIIQNPWRDPHFRELAPGYYLVQGGVDAILFEKIYRIVLSNNFTYHSGLFVDDQGREIHELFWTLGVDIDAFHFEAFNDMLGGTDFGPTFGGRFYWDIEEPGTVLSAVETFVQKLNGGR